MRKNLKRFLIITLLLGFLTSCSSRGNSSTSDSMSSDYSNSQPSISEQSAVTEKIEANETSGVDYDSSTGTINIDPQKIVYSSSLDISTEKYDEDLKAILALVQSSGGYVSSGYEYTNEYQDITYRHSTYTFKVPQDKYNEVLDKIASFGTVNNKSINAEDITKVYTDTKSYLDALRAKEERLLNFMSQATTLEDLLTIEDRLSDTRYEIENYEAQMKNLDNMVNYATIDLELSEKNTMIIKTGNDFGSKVTQAFYGSINSVVDFFQQLIIMLIYFFPYIIIVGIIVLIIFMIKKKHPKKTADTDKANEKTSE